MHAMLVWQLVLDHAGGHAQVYEPTTCVQLPPFKHGEEAQKLTWVPQLRSVYAAGHVQLNPMRTLLQVPPCWHVVGLHHESMVQLMPE